jgi:hypothetical protein
MTLTDGNASSSTLALRRSVVATASLTSLDFERIRAMRLRFFSLRRSAATVVATCSINRSAASLTSLDFERIRAMCLRFLSLRRLAALAMAKGKSLRRPLSCVSSGEGNDDDDDDYDDDCMIVVIFMVCVEHAQVTVHKKS